MGKSPLKSVTILLSAALVMTSSASLQAAELRVIAGGSMTASLNALAAPFEKATGHKLSIHFDSTPNIIARVNSGTPFDVVVVPVDVFKDAAAKARFVPGPTVDIARVGYGIAQLRTLLLGRIIEGMQNGAIYAAVGKRAAGVNNFFFYSRRS